MIYRDIKPDNFLIGYHDPHQVYLIDFGMVKMYRDQRTGQHIPYRERKSLSGTARYMSINTHLGREQSRRDDLESLGHVFFYFLRGSLPWQGLKAATNREKYERIGEKKQATLIKDLVAEGCAEEWGQYLAYTRGLKFEETPDYDHARHLIDRILARLPSRDLSYDWDNLQLGPAPLRRKGEEESIPVFGGITSTARYQSPMVYQMPPEQGEQQQQKNRPWWRRLFCL